MPFVVKCFVVKIIRSVLEMNWSSLDGRATAKPCALCTIISLLWFAVKQPYTEDAAAAASSSTKNAMIKSKNEMTLHC